MKALIEHLRQKLNDACKANEDLSLTVHGKPGQGNVRMTVHYMRDNLVCAMLYRADLRKAEDTSGEKVDMYLRLLPHGNQPWTEVPKKELTHLNKIPAIVGRAPETTLPESMEVAQVLLNALEDFERKHAYIRQWRAANGGTGVEIIFVCEEDGKRHVFELAVNFYFKANTAAIAELIKNKQQ